MPLSEADNIYYEFPLPEIPKIFHKINCKKCGKELQNHLIMLNEIEWKEDSLYKVIEKITDKDSFIQFLNLLAKDYATNQPEWENKSVIDFIKAMSSWTEDFSASPANNIDWEKVDYKTMAKILYMGKMYE